jgi:hypothetical protein
MLTRTLYKVLGGTLSAINWHEDVRDDHLKDLSWASGEWGEVGFHNDGDARCYLSADPDLDGVSVLDEDNGTSVDDDIAIAHRRWRGDRRRAAIRALEHDQRYDRMGWVQL